MNKIQVEIVANGSLEKVWKYWNEPEHITKWAFASDDWESPHAENDLKKNGRFLTRMAAKDGSVSFDLLGTYTNVIPNELIEYIMDKKYYILCVDFLRLVKRTGTCNEFASIQRAL